MSPLTRWLDKKLYQQYSARWDDRQFREIILQYVASNDVMLDIGAGAGVVAEMNFRGKVARICGIDPDERVIINPFLDEAHVGLAEMVPYDDETFDVVVCDNVFEHLENPLEVFREVERVLKPGGRFLAKTPNSMHYMPMIARLTPYVFHRFVNRLRGRDVENTFPTRYRANSPRAISAFAKAAGLQVDEVRLVEGRPEYLRIFAPAYFVGWMYERAVNKVPGLARFRILLIAVMSKPGSSHNGRRLDTA